MFFIDIELLFGVFFLGLTVQIRKKNADLDGYHRLWTASFGG